MTIQTLTGKTEKIDYPVGTMMFWHGYAAPPGWLVCDGSAISISTYRRLYNVLTNGGTTFPYGANVGSTFLLPNVTNRFISSPSLLSPAVSGANSNVGATAGSNTHTHTWDLGLTIGASGSDTHSHGINTNNTTGINTPLSHNQSGGVVASTNTTQIINVTTTAVGATANAGATHSHNSQNAISVNHNSSHSHNKAADGSSNNNAHSHNYTISGNSYTPSSVSHLPPYISLGLTIIYY